MNSTSSVSFFFQAEDGIRDVAVTGVQTCALPILHVPDTSFAGIIAFDKQFTAQLDKDGIIVDERDNSGGQIPDFYTEKLKRELLAVVAPRDTADIPWPPVAIYGPKIMIVNELAGSGGDAFPWFFHGEKIGPIVGTRTRSEEHTSELQSRLHLVCRLLLEKKKTK